MLNWLFDYLNDAKKKLKAENKIPDQLVQAGFKAIEMNDGELLGSLLKDKKLDPNARLYEGDWTLLHKSIMCMQKNPSLRGKGLVDRNSVLSVLLHAHPNVNLCYEIRGRKISPLHLAVRSGYGDVANILLAYGADINLRDEKGKAPFDYKHNKEKEDDHDKKAEDTSISLYRNKHSR